MLFRNIFRFIIFFLYFTQFKLIPHIFCLSSTVSQKSKSQNTLSSKYHPFNNKGYYTQNSYYDNQGAPLGLGTNNLTIEVLPNDDEDDDGYLKFGLLRDAYGYGDSIQCIDMVVDQVVYNCNYTSNVYSKNKKWHAGLLKAICNHGSLGLILYEMDEDSKRCGKVIDTLDVFNIKGNSLAGLEFTTSRNIIDVQNIVGTEQNRKVPVQSSKPPLKTGLRKSQGPHLHTLIKDSPSDDTQLTHHSSVCDSTNQSLNVNEIMKNIEFALDDE